MSKEIRLVKGAACSELHENGTFFLKRLVRGLAISAKFLIQRGNYEQSPRELRTSFVDRSAGTL